MCKKQIEELYFSTAIKDLNITISKGVNIHNKLCRDDTCSQSLQKVHSFISKSSKQLTFRNCHGILGR